MKRLSKITESIWSDLQDRSSGETLKREDGIKFHTCLGLDIILKNPKCDYNGLIEDMIKGGNEYEFGIQSVRSFGFSTEELANIRKFEAPYDYMIYDGGHGTDLIAKFSSYDEVLEFQLDDEFEDKYWEDDYIAICRTIATKYKEVGDCLSYVPSGKAFMLTVDRVDTSEYEHDYAFTLISESDVYYWICDNMSSQESGLDLMTFKNDIIDEFPELRDMDFICWQYTNNGGCYIAIPAYNINNLLNIRKYIEFTKKWFKV